MAGQGSVSLSCLGGGRSGSTRRRALECPIASVRTYYLVPATTAHGVASGAPTWRPSALIRLLSPSVTQVAEAAGGGVPSGVVRLFVQRCALDIVDPLSPQGFSSPWEGYHIDKTPPSAAATVIQVGGSVGMQHAHTSVCEVLPNPVEIAPPPPHTHTVHDSRHHRLPCACVRPAATFVDASSRPPSSRPGGGGSQSGKPRPDGRTLPQPFSARGPPMWPPRQSRCGN